MLFSHYLLDEIIHLLYHFNPVGYQLEQEGSYDNEASLIFSSVYALTPKPGAVINSRAISSLAAQIRTVFETMLGHADVEERMYTLLAQTMLETAQDVESSLQNDYKLSTIFYSDMAAFGEEPMQAEYDEPVDAEFTEVEEKITVVDATEKWKLN